MGPFDSARCQLKLRMVFIEIQPGRRLRLLRLGRDRHPGQQLPLRLLRTHSLLDFRFLRLAGEPLGACGHRVCWRQIAGTDSAVDVLGEPLEELALKYGQTVL